MVNSFAVGMVYYEQSKLVHELALFCAHSADEAEGLAMHDVVTGGRELVSLLTFPNAVSSSIEICNMAPVSSEGIPSKF